MVATSEENLPKVAAADLVRFKRNAFIRELRDVHGVSLPAIASQLKLSVRQVGSILKHREPFKPDK